MTAGYFETDGYYDGYRTGSREILGNLAHQLTEARRITVTDAERCLVDAIAKSMGLVVIVPIQGEAPEDT